tara:strand:+ start:623 stop:799 length:177 start_codon:yes stop_codon:yes gene_type:complete
MEMLIMPQGPGTYGSKKGRPKKKATKTRLDPSCWKGYRKSGTKVKGGTRVNNCVKIKK